MDGSLGKNLDKYFVEGEWNIMWCQFMESARFRGIVEESWTGGSQDWWLTKREAQVTGLWKQRKPAKMESRGSRRVDGAKEEEEREIAAKCWYHFVFTDAGIVLKKALV